MIWLLMGLNAISKPLDAHFLYFVLVDRFYNAQTDNDPSIDLQDPQSFHGGDLHGIAEKLPYLEQLGVDALWLSPIFHMRREKFEGHGAFHGYWIQDLDKIEPAFGGEEALDALSSTLKKKNIALVMDMVYNHVSFDSPMVQEKPDWFHEVKPIVDWNDPYELTHHQVHGLPDLDQSKEPVYEYLKDRSLQWRESARLSGFRIDAIRHMENDFLARLSGDLKPASWLLGEDFQGNPAALIRRAKETGLDALFDFPLYYATTDLFCRGSSPANVASNLWLDRDFPSDFQLVTFLDNHDLPRLHSICSERDALQALLFQFSIRGIPMLTYGTELGLKGDHEPFNRADMPWGTQSAASDMIKTLVSLRKENPVMEKGLGFVDRLDDSSLIYTQYLDGNSVTIAINRGEKELSYPHSLSNCFEATDQFSPCTSKKIAPNSTRLWIAKKKQPKPKKRTVTFDIYPCKDQDLRVVGSALELGGWDPKEGLRLKEIKGRCQAKLRLEKNAILRFKIVEVIGNEVKWKEGPDQILWKKRKFSLKLED